MAPFSRYMDMMLRVFWNMALNTALLPDYGSLIGGLTQ
jgi:hypothetical protein